MNKKWAKIVLLKKRKGIIKKIVRLFREAAPYFEGDEHDLKEELRDYFAGECRDTHYFVAMLDGEIVGLIGYLQYGRDVYNLGWFFVRRDLQGCGIGTFLLNKVERDLAGKARLLMIECMSSPRTIHLFGFYISHGYRAINIFPDFYEDEDGDMILFYKRLKAKHK